MTSPILDRADRICREARTVIRLEPACDGLWTICRVRDGAPVEGTRTRQWSWARAVWIAGRAAEAAGLDVVCGEPESRLATPPPPRPGSATPVVPHLLALTTIDREVSFGPTTMQAEIPTTESNECATVRP